MSVFVSMDQRALFLRAAMNDDSGEEQKHYNNYPPPLPPPCGSLQVVGVGVHGPKRGQLFLMEGENDDGGNE